MREGTRLIVEGGSRSITMTIIQRGRSDSLTTIITRGWKNIWTTILKRMTIVMRVHKGTDMREVVGVQWRQSSRVGRRDKIIKRGCMGTKRIRDTFKNNHFDTIIIHEEEDLWVSHWESVIYLSVIYLIKNIKQEK